MKKILSVLSALAVLSIAVSCRKDNPEEPKGAQIKVTGLEETNQVLANNPADMTFTVEAAVNWNVVKSSMSWARMSGKTSGKAGEKGEVRLAFSNNDGEAREGKVTVVAGDETAEFTFSQAGADPALSLECESLTDNVYSCTCSAGSIVISVNSNYDWSVSSSADWVTANPSNGTGGVPANVTVNIAQNMQTSSRTATLTFAVGNLTETVTINQEEYILVPELSIVGIEPLAADVYGINPESPDAISKTIIVRSTTEWSIKKGANSDWLSISKISGAANTDCSVTLNAAANATGAKRQATFTVEAKYVNPDTTLVKYFSVTQNVAGTVIAYWVFNENEAETAYPYLYETIDANGNTGVVVNDKGEKTYDKVDNVIKAKGGNTEAWVRFRDHTYLRPSSGTPVGAPVIKYIGDFNKISIEVPGTTLAAGDVVRLDFYVCASDKSPKYWVVDGRNNTTFGYWPALQVVPVASQYKYNLELAGGAQHVVVDQEITESATNTLFFRLHTSVSAAGGSGLYKYCVDGSTVSGPSEAPLYLLGSSDAEGHYPYNMTITKL